MRTMDEQGGRVEVVAGCWECRRERRACECVLRQGAAPTPTTGKSKRIHGATLSVPCERSHSRNRATAQRSRAAKRQRERRLSSLMGASQQVKQLTRI
jgi:hypothetical protein